MQPFTKCLGLASDARFKDTFLEPPRIGAFAKSRIILCLDQLNFFLGAFVFVCVSNFLVRHNLKGYFPETRLLKTHSAINLGV